MERFFKEEDDKNYVLDKIILIVDASGEYSGYLKVKTTIKKGVIIKRQ